MFSFAHELWLNVLFNFQMSVDLPVTSPVTVSYFDSIVVTETLHIIYTIFLAAPTACGTSQARDGTHAPASNPSHCSDNTRSPTRYTTG